MYKYKLHRYNGKIYIVLKHRHVAQTCVSCFKKHYLHLRARGGVEESKSIDSASEPCNIKIIIKLVTRSNYFDKVLKNIYIPYRLLLHYHTKTKKIHK